MKTTLFLKLAVFIGIKLIVLRGKCGLEREA
jgi:hypothetical protein